MNKEIKAQWLTALRSGEYKQGSGFLRIVGQNGTENRFCCLGVLCDLAVKAGVTEVLTERYETRYGKDGDTNTAVLPGHVREWAGLDTHAGSYGAEKSYSLTGDNDGGMTFSEIADVIEKEF